MKPSIFYSALRSFFITLFVMLGIGIGFIPVVLIFSLLVSGNDENPEVKTHFSSTILTNANGVRKMLPKSAPVILKINVSGFIGSDNLNMYLIREMLTESREGEFSNNRIKALLIHIDSPGGTVTDADGIYRSLNEYKKKYNIPVYGYVDGMCASGAMYIASACDKIYASDVSLVGSVGVISPSFFNFTGLMEKVGVESKTLFSGKGKDSLNPFRPWKAGEEDNFKALIDYYYTHFVNVVTSNRKDMSKTRLINDYGANVFPAEKALDLGYIDGANHSLDDTIMLLAKSIGIEDDYYQVIKMDRKVSFADLFNRGSPMVTGKLNHKLELPNGFDAKLMNQFLYLYLPSE